MKLASVELEFFLLKRNQLYFGQSEHEVTSFTIESMKQKLDWNTLTEVAKEVLQGIYDDSEEEELREMMKLVLKNFVKIAPQNTNQETMVAQLRGKMKVWREGTTTSPSERHLGHYKSLFTAIDHSFESDERKE